MNIALLNNTEIDKTLQLLIWKSDFSDDNEIRKQSFTNCVAFLFDILRHFLLKSFPQLVGALSHCHVFSYTSSLQKSGWSSDQFNYLKGVAHIVEWSVMSIIWIFALIGVCGLIVVDAVAEQERLRDAAKVAAERTNVLLLRSCSATAVRCTKV